MKLFGVRLKAMRRQKKVSQEELAEAMNVSRSTVQRMERGGPTHCELDGFLMLSEFLDVSLMWLGGRLESSERTHIRDADEAELLKYYRACTADEKKALKATIRISHEALQKAQRA